MRAMTPPSDPRSDRADVFDFICIRDARDERSTVFDETGAMNMADAVGFIYAAAVHL